MGILDLNNLKKIQPKDGLITLITRTYAINGTDGSTVAAIGALSVPLLPSSFTPDTVPPSIVNISLDMGNNLIAMLMTEPVPVDSVQVTGEK